MVDPELFERYRRALGANADLCEEAVGALVARLDGLTQMEQAAYLAANYPKLVRAYGKVAADVARQFYQESRDAWQEATEDSSDYVAQAAQPIPEQWAMEDVGEALTGGHGMTVARLPGKASKRVMQRADETIGYNVRRDPAKGRWAVVPHPGACGWCVMVASNGWAYSERSVNAQRHDHCKCSVAVDFDRDDPSLAGYDPDALRARYREGIADAGGEEAIQARWDALPPEEQAKYRRKGRSAYDAYRTGEVARAMDARVERGRLDSRMYALAKADAKSHFDAEGARRLADAFDASMSAHREWFLKKLTQERYDEAIGSLLSDIGKIYGMEITGEFALGPKLYSAIPDGDEIWAATRMRGHFEAAQFLSTDRRRRKGNPDLLVDGKYIDIKTPHSIKRVSERLTYAADQCRNRGQEDGIAILSTLRIDEGAHRCMGFAQAKVNRGQLVRVYVVQQDSVVTIAK